MLARALVARHTPVVVIPAERITRAILLVHGRKVLLDADLAALYGVETRALVQAVKRNAGRFPADFMFQVTRGEARNLRSQSVISSSRSHGGRRHSPYAFTEQGVAMLSRAFVKLRAVMASHVHLARKLEQLEKRHDAQLKVVFDAIRQLMIPPVVKTRRVGFRSEE